MPDDIDDLVRRLIGGDVTAPTEILERAGTDRSPLLQVAAALVSDEPAQFLARAAEYATTTRDRQLVALATAHVNGDAGLLDALVRDHLVDHPDNILAAWIAAQHTPAGRPAGTNQKESPCTTSRSPRQPAPPRSPRAEPRPDGW